MASRYCAKCGREVAEGKRFCGGCGQPVSAVAAPEMPDPVAASEPAPLSCSHCGAALAPGKRFCKQCGKQVGGFAPVAWSATAASPQPAISPTTPSCTHCGSPLVPGKRFCKKCGQPVDSNATAAQVDADPIGKGGFPAAQSSAFDLPAEMPVVASANEPDVALHAQDVLPSNLTSAWEPTESRSQPPSSPSLAAAVYASPEPQPESFRQPKAKIGLVIGVAAAVLLTAGGVLTWHFYSHRGDSGIATSPVEPQQTMVAPPTKNQPTTTTPAQAPKPAPGIQEHATSGPTKSQPESGATTPPHVSSTNTPPDAVLNPNATAPEPTIAPPPSSTPTATPAAPRSGTLHYQGPPVPYNGVVIFDHLPQARLKFTFNRQAWSLTLKLNPDGTKRATLISLVQGYQTSCDLGWEIIE